MRASEARLEDRIALPRMGMDLLRNSQFRPKAFPVIDRRENHSMHLHTRIFLSKHFGRPALIFVFSQFFSLLAGNAIARSVRVELRGAPAILM